jgi:signal transduction histidine kinase
MPVQSWILFLVAAINLGFVGILSFRLSKIRSNRFFIIAIACNVIWSVGDALLIGAQDRELALIGSQLFFIAPMFTAYFLLLFSRAFLDDKPIHRYMVVLLSLPPILLSVIIARNKFFLIDEFTLGSPNTFTVNQVPFLIYTSFFSVYFGLSYLILYLNSKKKTGTSRSQIRYILYAAISSSFLAMISNLALPLMGVSLYIWLGPIFTLSYIVIVSLAVVKHQLFDLRAAAARVLAYVASIGSMIIVYSSVVYVLSSSNILSNNLTNLQRISYILIAVITGLLFQPFKNFFDKLTNKIFYQDAYDPQSLIDVLNNTLVNTIELEELLTKSALIIQENLKTSFCTFYIRETSYFKERIIGAHRKDPEIDEIDKLQQLAPRLHRKIHSVENEATNDNEKEISRIMRKNDIEILARIVSTLDYEIKGIGYMLIGPKKSGSQYSKQDIKIIEIIANELVIAIENALRFEEIEQFNVTLQKKIDEATKELKQTNDKLRALDEAKDEFVSMASHQLRTPLTSIKGYLSMVLEGDAGKITDQQKTMLGQAFFSSQRMVYLISDLLNVSRLKTGKFVIETKAVYLPDVVESELNQLYEGANAKNLKLSFTKPKKFATMNLDEMKLRQVIMNFTDNAIYYTPSGGKITVELKETPKSIEFIVKDSGIGVPKDQQHKLFTKFYRADNARKARPDGTGLGLFMAKKVIIAQGGSMIFDSKENKGSTFGFSFPKEKLEVKEQN